MFKTLLGNAYAIAKRLELAAQENQPLVLILRNDGTADIRLAEIFGDGYVFFKDRGTWHFVTYKKTETYRMPFGTPIILAVEGVPVAVDKDKLLWGKILSDSEFRLKLCKAVADMLPDNHPLKIPLARGSMEALRAVAPYIHINLEKYGVVDGAAIRELQNPIFRTEAIRNYYEKKLATWMEKVLELKIAYETSWTKYLKLLMPLAVIILVLIVAAWFLPYVLRFIHSFSQVKVP